MIGRSSPLRAVLAGLVAVGLGLGLWWCGWGRGGRGGAASLRAWRFRPADHATVGYRFQLQGRVVADRRPLLRAALGRTLPDASALSRAELELEGTLQMRFFRLSKDRYRVAARLRGARLRSKGLTAPLVGLNDRLFGFEMSTLGYFSRFRFLPGLPEFTRSLLRSVMAALQVGLPRHRKLHWATYEVDPTGRYRARYEVVFLDGMQGRLILTKQKAAYLSTRAARRVLADQAGRTAVIPGPERSVVILPLGGDLPLRYFGRGSLRARIGAKTWASSRSRFTAQRVVVEDETGLPGSLAELDEALSSTSLVADEQQRPDPRFDGLGPVGGLRGALDAYLRMLSAGESSYLAEQFLKDYLRRHPTACYELVDLLDRGRKGVGFKQELVLWRLLAETGHPDAQRALLGAVRDPERAELTHYRALAVIHDIQAPTAEMIRGLWDQFLVLSASPETSDGSLQTMALLALGSLAGQPGASRELRAEVVGHLTDGLSAAESPEQRAAYLDALGNLGREDILPAVEPYLAAEDPGVRRSAYGALRRLKGPRALETLTRFYDTESSDRVRGAALGVLARMEPSRQAMSWVEKELGLERSPELQARLATILGQNLGRFPENERALRALLARNPPLAVKRVVYRYIAPRR